MTDKDLRNFFLKESTDFLNFHNNPEYKGFFIEIDDVVEITKKLLKKLQKQSDKK